MGTHVRPKQQKKTSWIVRNHGPPMTTPCFQGRLHDYTPITMVPRTWCTKEMDPGHLGFLYLYSSFMFFCIPRFLYCVHALAKRLLIWLIFAHYSSFLVKQMTNLNRFIQFWGSTIAAAKRCTRFFHASSLTTLGPEPSGQKLSWSGRNSSQSGTIQFWTAKWNPIVSMYGIYANIWDIFMVNVTIYSIHGSYGNVDDPCWNNKSQCWARSHAGPHSSQLAAFLAEDSACHSDPCWAHGTQPLLGSGVLVVILETHGNSR